jgi:S-adenosylmethionine synthetase
MFEKVNPQHPDKVADRIAGALVDLAYAKQENPKVAVEVLLGHGECKIFAESSYNYAYDEVKEVVDRICGNMNLYLKSVKQDIHLATNQQGMVRAGDNGIFKGCVVTQEQKLLTSVAQDIFDRYGSDGKYIIVGHGKLYSPHFDVTICQSCMPQEDNASIKQLLESKYNIQNCIINPLGEWTGGLDVDCGATNRKLGSDMGDGVTGGGLHGKDLSKADVAVNIACYQLANRNNAEITALCAIGDEMVTFRCANSDMPLELPYSDVLEMASKFIKHLGGFEKLAEWGLF